MGMKLKQILTVQFLHVADAPWPGFTPDLLSIVLVVAS
jgi:UDP-N-acetylglucosamine 1-carboxyvinyltransferase